MDIFCKLLFDRLTFSASLFPLNKDHISVLNMAIAGHNLLKCGQVGTGKPTVMKFLVKDLRRRMSVSILCTTDIACMQYVDEFATTVQR